MYASICKLTTLLFAGDMIPPYRDALLGVLLGVARDTEPLVRASCLSNLGDVCKLLRFSLGNVIHEVRSWKCLNVSQSFSSTQK